MKAAVALLLALLLGACGGGGGGVRPDPPPSPQRTDLLMGYYGGCPTCATETKDHANLYMTRPWGPGGPIWLDETMPQLQAARDNGQRVMLGLPGTYDPGGVASVTAAFQAIKAAGLAGIIVSIYPIDEPDVNGKSDAEVTAMNATLRGLMTDVGMTAAIAVIYGCATGKRPGLASYDWIGCDDYGRGCGTAPDASLKAALRPDQRLMLIPGGANPWRQDPACFLNAANADPQVVAIMPFLWVDWEQPGVRDNGMREVYCETGRKIRGLDPALCRVSASGNR